MLGRRRKLGYRKRLNLTPDFHLNLTTQSVNLVSINQSDRKDNATETTKSSPNQGGAYRAKRYRRTVKMLTCLSILGLACGFGAFSMVSASRSDTSAKTESGQR